MHFRHIHNILRSMDLDYIIQDNLKHIAYCLSKNLFKLVEIPKKIVQSYNS